MGLIREPINVDFYVEGGELTDDECRLISEFIKNQKLMQERLFRPSIKPLSKKKKKLEVL